MLNMLKHADAMVDERSVDSDAQHEQVAFADHRRVRELWQVFWRIVVRAHQGFQSQHRVHSAVGGMVSSLTMSHSGSVRGWVKNRQMKTKKRKMMRAAGGCQ